MMAGRGITRAPTSRVVCLELVFYLSRLASARSRRAASPVDLRPPIDQSSISIARQLKWQRRSLAREQPYSFSDVAGAARFISPAVGADKLIKESHKRSCLQPAKVAIFTIEGFSQAAQER